MYQPRTPGYRKRDPVMRWALPDRVFFACGACHILAHAFLERWGRPDMAALWLRPAAGFTGNHIVVATADWTFDYHGYAPRAAYFAHVNRRARQRWPGWTADLMQLPRDVLISEAKSKTYPGLWLREPKQFLHDAAPRARAFLERFPGPSEARRSTS